MEVKELIRLPDEKKKVKIEAKEVVRNLFDKPHLMARIRITNWYFPHRALEPFAVVGDVVSRLVIIDKDSRAANAYFDKPLPRAELISFGYGKVITWDFQIPIDPKKIIKLDRSRLPKETIDPFRPR